MVIASVNPEAFQFRILGRYWLHLDAPRHVMLIPMKLLAEKLEFLGMEAELITTTDQGSIGWNAFGWELSLLIYAHSFTLKKYYDESDGY